MITLAFNLGGIALIGLIVWWFWLSQPRSRHASNAGPVEVVVHDGVYAPARIEVEAGKPITLRFLRRDTSPSAEKVIFDELDVSADLPVGKPQDVTLTLKKRGRYPFTCQTGMYRGTLIVR